MCCGGVLLVRGCCDVAVCSGVMWCHFVSLEYGVKKWSWW